MTDRETASVQGEDGEERFSRGRLAFNADEADCCTCVDRCDHRDDGICRCLPEPGALTVEELRDKLRAERKREPSDEAVEAAAQEFVLDDEGDAEPWLGDDDARRGWAHALLTAAYAIDLPALLAAHARDIAELQERWSEKVAKARAEGEAARTAEIVAWLRELAGSGYPERRGKLHDIADDLTERFPC